MHSRCLDGYNSLLNGGAYKAGGTCEAEGGTLVY